MGSQAADIEATLEAMRGLMQSARPDGEVLGLMQRLQLTLPQILSMARMRQGPQTVSLLASELRLTPGAVSRLIDQLVEQRLVLRVEGADRRRKELSLSTAGQRTLAQLDANREAGLVRLLQQIDPALRADLVAVLRRVAAAVLAPNPSQPETTP